MALHTVVISCVFLRSSDTYFYFSEYRHASLIAITETWYTPNSTGVTIDGFHVVRGDRTGDSGKEGGGGVCFYQGNTN